MRRKSPAVELAHGTLAVWLAGLAGLTSVAARADSELPLAAPAKTLDLFPEKVALVRPAFFDVRAVLRIRPTFGTVRQPGGLRLLAGLPRASFDYAGPVVWADSRRAPPPLLFAIPKGIDTALRWDRGLPRLLDLAVDTDTTVKYPQILGGVFRPLPDTLGPDARLQVPTDVKF